jgi:hypothetical protein
MNRFRHRISASCEIAKVTLSVGPLDPVNSVNFFKLARA